MTAKASTPKRSNGESQLFESVTFRRESSWSGDERRSRETSRKIRRLIFLYSTRALGPACKIELWRSGKVLLTRGKGSSASAFPIVRSSAKLKLVKIGRA